MSRQAENLRRTAEILLATCKQLQEEAKALMHRAAELEKKVSRANDLPEALSRPSIPRTRRCSNRGLGDLDRMITRKVLRILHPLSQRLN
jgi:hypothetical protein